MIPYVYIVVRTDIKLEYQLVQACHSAIEAGYAFSKPKLEIHLVVLSVPTQEELNLISEQLEVQNIKHRMFNEKWGNMGNTALATEPIYKQTEGILNRLSLLCYGE